MTGFIGMTDAGFAIVLGLYGFGVCCVIAVGMYIDDVRNKQTLNEKEND